MDAQDPSMGADPSEGSEDESQEQYSITITSNGDGTYTITPSDSDESEDDPQGGDGSQTAQSIDEVCQIVTQMLQEEESEDSGDGNAPVPADQARKVWDQMAKKRDQSRM
jgi:hypothetical protein